MNRFELVSVKMAKEQNLPLDPMKISGCCSRLMCCLIYESAQYHMIQQIHTDVDVADVELLHAPTWFVRYDHKGNKIVLVIDANSGGVINSIGSAV
jgi:hypothetical protein